MTQSLNDDIVSRLRATERAIWDGDDAEERRAFIKMVADEIERLRKLATTWNICAERLVESSEGEAYEKALAFYLDCQRLAKEAYYA